MTELSTQIHDYILDFHQRLTADPFHRYRSWEHCYRFFMQQPTDVDLASLHLGFYLASWGMYRGSTFLLQKDYRVHQPVVEELLKPRYAAIRAVSLTDLRSERGPKLITMILELVRWIQQCYVDTIGEDARRINVTDTLATKILMGTLGCIPAYDRFFIDGIKQCGLRFSYLNRKNFSALIDYCVRHEGDFRQAQQRISADGFIYPDMKVIDMYFWMRGAHVNGKTE